MSLRPIPLSSEPTPERVELSVVAPVYNERENLLELHRQLRSALDNLPYRSEILLVDDGSKDGSDAVLREIAAQDPTVRVIRFRRNFGQTAALSAGFDHAQGDIVVTLDADLQNDPADIGRLIEKLNEGYDVVSGWRQKRHDGFLLRRLPSRIANRLIVQMTGVRLHDFGCTLKAYRRDVVKNVRLYGEMHRFIPALARWVGAEIAELPVNHRPRVWGRSKYGLSRTLRVILDLITIRFLQSFSTRPIQIFGKIGLYSGAVGFVICAWLTIGKLVAPERYSLLARMPMLLLGILLIFVGVQFVTLGLLGEMMTRTYHESQNKPIYVIREILSQREGVRDKAEPSANSERMGR